MSTLQPRRGAVPEATLNTLPRIFEQHAAAAPDAMAVVYGEWRLTYRDLNQAANRLAHRLLALGVAPEVRVGLSLDRGPDLLVAMLATLKAGGAYVPFDPHWPRERLGRMLTVAQPRVLITRAALRGLLPDGEHVVLDLDRDQPDIAAVSCADPQLEILRAQPCYVMFTSGSTGTPKGVVVTHGNLEGLFPPLCDRLGFGSRDVWTWFHSASFGFSVWEIWGALLHGGCLVIVPEHIRNEPAALGELIADEQVTVFSQTPSAFRRLLGHEGFHRAVAASALRYLALSGEALRPEDIATWLEQHAASPVAGTAPRLLSTYAITETGGQVTLRVYGAVDATGANARNIGRPLAGRHILVLDAAGRPLPTGEAGELWVGGECVASGYLGEPGLTAQRFPEFAVPDHGVMRGYRTGDHVRLLPDGTLEYLGRVDGQIKYRGYRVEPGEVEAALCAHPGVRDAAIAIQADASGNPRLTAYIVSAPAAAPVTADACEFWPSLGAYGIYDALLYGFMNAEPVRLAAYRAAFAQHVPGKVVLDIGTGEDALLARLCVEAGAKHVYAVEVLEPVARRATDLVRTLGLEERITVLHGDIANLALPMPIEVCTQGIIGNIGSADGIAAAWNAARRSFDHGCIPVPARCVTRIAALELPAEVRDNPHFAPLGADYARRIFAAAGQPFDVRLCVRNVAAGQLLTVAAEFEDLDFHGPLAVGHSGSADVTVTRDGCFDGFVLWTVVTTGAGRVVDYFQEQRAWLPVFLPIVDAGVPVRRGDLLRVRWRSLHESDARHPDYEVSVVLESSAGEQVFNFVSRHAETARGATRLHRHLLASLDGSREPVSVTVLRSWLDRSVPDYMVPQSWVFLPELPLTPGGKLDREALPAPGRTRPQLAGPVIAPRNAVETALALLWAETLGLEEIGVEDDFFDLGGDSITAVQLTTATQRWLDATVPLAALFAAPSVAAMSRYLEAAHGAMLLAALRRRSGDRARDRERGEL